MMYRTFINSKTAKLFENPLQRKKLNKICHPYQNYATASLSSETPKPYTSIPGLSSLPILGTIHHFLPVIGSIGPQENYGKMLETLHKKFGSVVRLEGGAFGTSGEGVVVLYEPEHYAQVFKAEDVTPYRPGFAAVDYYREVLRKDIYNGELGLTAAQGAQWREFRTKVNPAMLRHKRIKLYTSELEEVSKEMVARLIKLPSDYLLNNFDTEIEKFALESISLVGLGQRIGCLQDNLADDHPGKVLMKSIKEITSLGFILELAPFLWKYMSSGTMKKLIKQLDIQWEFSSKLIEQTKKRIDERDHDIPDEEKSIIEKLLAVDEKVAVIMANEMLMAGIDTVAFTTIALLYRLAINQKVQDKLREEIKAGELRYLKACIKEILRLNPVVSANLRRTTMDHIVAGYQVPKGVNIITPHEYLSKLEKYYPKPTEFIPERWLVEKSDPLYYGNAHPMVTLPFGYGVRICIGRRIAELEIEVLIQTLIKRYVVEWNGPPLNVVSQNMNTIKKPFYVVFRPL